MSNNKQNSIEWLVEKFAKYYAIHQLEDEIEQAKAMREKEIKDAYDQGDADAYWELKHNEPRTYVDKHDYYNETYGNTNGN